MGKMRYSNNTLFKQLGIAAVVMVLVGGFAVTPSYGQATPDTFITSLSISGSGISVCTNEPVEFIGTANLVLHGTFYPDDTGGYKFEYVVFHSNFQGVKAVGTISGNQYVSTQAENRVDNIRVTSAGEFIAQTHGTLISQGKELNVLAEFSGHLTVNANGQVTVENSRMDVRCI